MVFSGCLRVSASNKTETEAPETTAQIQHFWLSHLFSLPVGFDKARRCKQKPITALPQSRAVLMKLEVGIAVAPPRELRDGAENWVQRVQRWDGHQGVMWGRIYGD